MTITCPHCRSLVSQSLDRRVEPCPICGQSLSAAPAIQHAWVGKEENEVSTNQGNREPPDESASSNGGAPVKVVFGLILAALPFVLFPNSGGVGAILSLFLLVGYLISLSKFRSLTGQLFGGIAIGIGLVFVLLAVLFAGCLMVMR